MLDQMAQVPHGALGHVRDIEQIGENVIAVKAEQGNEVEKDGRNGGDKYNVVTKIVKHSAGGAGPNHHGDGGDENFDDHSGGPDQNSLPAPAEGPARGGVHVRGGGQDHQEH